MSLIDEIRLNLKEDYEIVNQYWLPRTYEADCDCLIVRHKKTGREFKISVEDWEEDNDQETKD